MPKRRGLNGQFRRLWAAVGVSSVGDGMVLVGFPLLALTLTRNPVAVAGVAIAARLPALLVALPVGALADRVDRRRFLILIEVLRLLVMGTFATIVATGRDNLGALYATAFLLGSLTIAFDVVSSAALSSIVGTDDLVRANARLFTAEVTGEEFVGQAVGGVAFATARSIPFVADAASFLASALLLRRAVPANEPAPRSSSLWSDLGEGLRWLWAEALLRVLFTLISTLAFCQAMVLAVLALYATGQLHMSATGYGLLLAVASIGTIFGTTVAKPVHDRLGAGWAIVGAGLVAGLSYPVMASVRSVFVVGGALAVESLAVVIGNVAARSIRQADVPAAMQGRAASAYQLVILSAVPLGSLAGGLVVAGWGIRTTMVVAGLLQLVVLAVTGPRLVLSVRRKAGGLVAGDRHGPADVRLDLRYTAGRYDSPMATVARRLQQALDESESATRRT